MFGKLARILALALVLVGAGLSVASSPAQAVSYRDLRFAHHPYCVYAGPDPVEGFYFTRCTATPAKYGNWSVTLAGYHNSHPLWILRRQGGKCLGVGGSASSSYLYQNCTAAGSKNVWEVFLVKNNRMVLKSFGAYQSWRQHKCLVHSQQPQLGPCSLVSASTLINR